MADNSREISENLQRAQTSINAAKDMIEKNITTLRRRGRIMSPSTRQARCC